MSTSLSVPHCPQLADGHCRAACAQMVLAFWGIERDQEWLASQLQMIPGAGTPGSRILRLCARNLDVLYESGDLDDLRIALDQGVPPIVW